MTVAKSGDTVSVHYRVTRLDGEEIDRSADGAPIEVTIGIGRYLPGFEAALVGMAPGDKKEITLAPEDAYGRRVDDLVQEVGRALFPPDIQVEVGQFYRIGKSEEDTMAFSVVAVEDDRIVVDGNHPLAGETLQMQIALIEILGSFSLDIDLAP